MYIGGLDIGTSGCKIAVFDENGKFVKCEYTEYDVKRGGGLHEIDPEQIFACVKRLYPTLKFMIWRRLPLQASAKPLLCLTKTTSRAPRQCCTRTRAAKRNVTKFRRISVKSSLRI